MSGLTPETHVYETYNIGGKAKGLLLLKSFGFRVPGFFIIDCKMVDEWKKNSSSREALIEIVYQNICHWDEAMFINVAIRSSALGEDSQLHSFAGIHNSHLSITGASDAAVAIADVIESAYSPLALAYRSKNALGTDIKMAVVVQKMVAATMSGVAFGVDLQTGCCQSAWISVVDGLAEKLVSGAVSGEEYCYKNGHLRAVATSNSPVRSEKQLLILKEIAKAALAISEKQKTVMDIEWAYDGHHCWFVQARPVTALPVEQNQNETIFDNSNIQESYCGVTTPLTFSYASMAYSRVYKQLMSDMLISKKDIQGFSPQLNNMIGLVKGRVYYNINSWYAGLLFMPSFGKRKKEMEDMMGVEEPIDFIREQNFTWQQKLARLPKVAQLVTVMVYRFIRMDALVRDFDTWFNKVYDSARIDTIYRQSEYEIVQNIRKYQELFLEKWGIPVLNDTKVMLEMGRVKRQLKKYGLELELKTLLYGSEIESIKPTLEIHKLAKIFADDRNLLKILFDQQGSELMESLLIYKAEIYKKVCAFISRYGDRCMGELKFETITMRQDPDVLLAMIRSYIKGGLHLKHELFQSHDHVKQDSVFARVASKMSRIEQFFFVKGVQKLKKSIADRELMRLHRTRNFGLMREYFLALGKLWQRRDFLSQPRDILFLTQEEIIQIVDGRYYGSEVKSIIELRKNQFEDYKNTPVKSQMKAQFPNSFSNYTIAEEAWTGATQFKGLSCSQGWIDGEVVVVNSPEEAVDLQGKILVAERTDPGWTPLFALVKGVIIEKGSMLSHSAVIAREMGIPAVLGIKDITKILKTGDRVRLDGTNGNISILHAARSKEKILDTGSL